MTIGRGRSNVRRLPFVWFLLLTGTVLVIPEATAQSPTADSSWTRELVSPRLGLGTLIVRPNATPPMIAFTALTDGNWDIYTWDLDPKHKPIQRTKSPFDENAPSLSWDHSFCIYETVDGRLWKLDLQGDAVPEALPFATDQKFDMHPSVSPDNIAVVLATSLDRSSDDSDLIVYDTVTKSFRRKLDLTSFQHDPNWAPDGRHVAFAHLQGRLQTGKPISEIWVMRTDAPWARQITLFDAFSISPSWAWDGQTIAFASNRSGQFDIWMAKVSTRGFRRITKHEAADTDPVFSADGRSILFVSTRGGRLGLWQHDLASGAVHAVLPFGPNIAVPCKDPDWK